ncbi:hypothetical protein AUC70_09025 [Methyloceanibacter stevinii]|uniref:Uncharacterized protein n=1 Tax=Methyloceanibacter stevinii TaxID=1774970 RepID=A0A1E3VJU6_9HYPH|nr:hypothetical protein AUC70_09025 [Methyloceanibacter stevinii]
MRLRKAAKAGDAVVETGLLGNRAAEVASELLELERPVVDARFGRGSSVGRFEMPFTMPPTLVAPYSMADGPRRTSMRSRA